MLIALGIDFLVKYICIVKRKDESSNTYIEAVPEYHVMDITLLGSDALNWQYNKVYIFFSIRNVFDRKKIAQTQEARTLLSF